MRDNAKYTIACILCFMIHAISAADIAFADEKTEESSLPLQKGTNNLSSLPEIDADNFWIFFQRALKNAEGKPSVSVPMPGASSASSLELAVDGDMKQYLSHAKNKEDMLCGFPDAKAAVLAVTSLDELRMPKLEPRFIFKLSDNELRVEDLAFAQPGLKNASAKEYLSSPLLLTGIKEILLDGKSFPCSFQGKPFRDPDAMVSYFFSGENSDIFVRYRFTSSDKAVGLNDTLNYSFTLISEDQELKSKLVSASPNEAIVKSENCQFECLKILTPYIDELRESIGKLKEKIGAEVQGIEAISAKLDNPPALKLFVVQQRTSLKDSIAAKKKSLQKLRPSSYADGQSDMPMNRRKRTLDTAGSRDLSGNPSSESSYSKISRLEDEIYQMQILLAKISDQYLFDLIEEYEMKHSMLKTEPFKRMKEDGKIGEFEESLSADLKGAEFQIISKKDRIVLKRVKVINRK